MSILFEEKVEPEELQFYLGQLWRFAEVHQLEPMKAVLFKLDDYLQDLLGEERDA